MTGIRAIVATVLLGTIAAAEDQPRMFRFNKADAGKLPAGWKAAQTGDGEGSVWKVVADDTGPGKTGHVLAQTAEGPKPLFNLCVLDDSNYLDVEITVSFKAVRGKIDQGGGIVWRYSDPNNYYIARMNPLEDNYRLYKVVDGKRKQLATKEDVKVPSNEWHTLTIRHKNDKVVCLLDGKPMLEATDDTFTSAGKIGLWTKADAQTYFDGLKIVGK